MGFIATVGWDWGSSSAEGTWCCGFLRRDSENQVIAKAILPKIKRWCEITFPKIQSSARTSLTSDISALFLAHCSNTCFYSWTEHTTPRNTFDAATFADWISFNFVIRLNVTNCQPFQAQTNLSELENHDRCEYCHDPAVSSRVSSRANFRFILLRSILEYPKAACI